MRYNWTGWAAALALAGGAGWAAADEVAALREVGKVFGLSDDAIDAINQLHWGWGSSATKQEMRQAGLDPGTIASRQRAIAIPGQGLAEPRGVALDRRDGRRVQPCAARRGGQAFTIGHHRLPSRSTQSRRFLRP